MNGPPALTDDEASTLKTFETLFESAHDIGNFAEMRAVLVDPEYEKLCEKDDLVAANKFVMDVRARMSEHGESAVLKALFIAVMRNMSLIDRTITKLRALDQARLLDLESRIKELDARLMGMTQ